MPEPLPLRKVLGPSVILAGVGVGSGEYILWPYISANAGIGFLYLAVIGVTIQYFLNMEIERYTLATGETAIAGFARSWKPWGILFCVFAVVPNIWPGWGTAGATTFTYLVGGSPNVIAMIVLLAIGVALTTSPVVYKALERAEFFKVGLTIVFLVVAIVAAIEPVRLGRAEATTPRTSARCRPVTSRSRRCSPASCSRARAARTTSSSPTGSARRASAWAPTCPKIESPVTGEPEPAPTTGSMVRQDEENINRFHGGSRSPTRSSSSPSGPSAWPRSSSSRSSPTRRCTARTSPTRPTSTSSRARARSSRTSSRRGSGRSSGSSARSRWCSSRWASSTTSRGSVADVLKTLHLRDNERWSESKIYACIVWTMCLLGIAVLAVGLRPAARAARALGLPERHRDVHLLDPADQAQPQRAAARDPRPRLAAGRARASPCCSTASSRAGT